MKKRGTSTRRVLPILLLTILFLSACKSGDTTEGPGGPFIGGTQGVLASFEPFGVEEESIYSIYDTETFPIELTLHNNGEYDLQQGDVTVRLLGPAEEEFEGIPSRQLQNTGVIDKISDLVPEGGEETITFAEEAHYLTPVTGFVDREWFANVEYHYQTVVVVPEVCLKGDLRDQRICEVAGPKTFFVSGAPVTVTAVEEDTAGRGLMAMIFSVRNIAGGDVTTIGGEFGIHDELSFSLDDPAWECKSAGRTNEARLRDSQAEIKCTLLTPLQEEDLFTKQVTLTLDYIYRDLVQESIRIKQSIR